jgi:4-amino-4-deoxy-L-arabinose transferase-like glycosyltransferase
MAAPSPAAPDRLPGPSLRLVEDGGLAASARALPLSGKREDHAAQRTVLMLLFVALTAAFLSRFWLFGNPVIQIDEQFYLLTGDRLLHGAVPFVDVWDRKPVGIFLIYAAIRLLGGEGIYQYQIVATLFAAATAFIISLMALRFTNVRGAAWAAAFYLLWLLIFDGAGGQTPVFYNPLVAGAALLTMRAVLDETDWRRVFALGCAAMLLTGLALQIKYTVIFEGMFFGLVLLWRLVRLGAPARRVFGLGLAWILVALAPTLGVLLWYVRAGHLDAFIFANFESILLRGHWPATRLASRLLTILGLSFPLLLCALVEVRSDRTGDSAPQTAAKRFALAWLASALLGVAVFGTYFIHYFLPVLVPLTLVSAATLGDRQAGVAVFAAGRERRISIAAFLGIAGIGLAVLVVPKRVQNRGDATQVQQLTSVINANLHGCMFGFDSDPILYLLTDSCLPTSRIFPNHLNENVEAKAVGVSPTDEVRRIMFSERPGIVLMSDHLDPNTNAATARIMQHALAAGYHAISQVKVGSRYHIVYKRNASRAG